jgi:hypothetical protein
VFVLASVNGRRWVKIRVKTLPWSVWLKTAKRDLMETMELTTNKLKAICEVDWATLGIGWAPEVSLDKTVVNEVCRVIVGRPGHLGHFPYIDYWQDAVFGRPTWLRPCLEEAYRIMVATGSTASECREKAKLPILTEEPEEVPPPYVPLYPLVPPVPSSTPPPLILDGEGQGTGTPVKSGSEASGASTPLTSLSPVNPIPTPSPLVLTPHSPLDWEHLTISVRTPLLLSDSCCSANAPEGSPEPHV